VPAVGERAGDEEDEQGQYEDEHGGEACPGVRPLEDAAGEAGAHARGFGVCVFDWNLFRILNWHFSRVWSFSVQLLVLNGNSLTKAMYVAARVTFAMTLRMAYAMDPYRKTSPAAEVPLKKASSWRRGTRPKRLNNMSWEYTTLLTGDFQASVSESAVLSCQSVSLTTFESWVRRMYQTAACRMPAAKKHASQRPNDFRAFCFLCSLAFCLSCFCSSISCGVGGSSGGGVIRFANSEGACALLVSEKSITVMLCIAASIVK
jgi:hypothetical protein